MAELPQPAGLHGGAAELQQMEQVDVVQQHRQAVVGGGAGKPWGGRTLQRLQGFPMDLVHA